jgi:antitoxin component YwqK of YwqJK toxin-antitoxin module
MNPIIAGLALFICSLMNPYSPKTAPATHIKKTSGPDSSSNSINQFDKEGKKNGLWFEMKGTEQLYYKHGLKNGICIEYDPKTHLMSEFCEFKDDKLTGDFYFWDTLGILQAKASQFADNTDIRIKKLDGKKYLLPGKCYLKLYYQTGVLRAEGVVVSEEGIEMDFYKVGTWKYYDYDEKLQKQETYKDGLYSDLNK